MDLSTLNYLNKMLGQEEELAASIRDSIPFIVTETGLVVMTVQVKAMVGRVAVIKDMADCRVKSTCYPDAPGQEVEAVFTKVANLAAVCTECHNRLEERRQAMNASARRLIEVLG